MKQQWEQVAGRIDALSLRERGILFVLTAFVIIFLVNSLVIEPQFARQKILSDRIKQSQAQLAALQLEIGQRAALRHADPDAENKRRLAGARQQLAQIDRSLLAVQKNLVLPEKMASLLEGILKRNQHLQLLSMKSLPVVNILDADGASAKIAVAGGIPAAGGAIYKHEMEIVVQGRYPDMLNYMRELEKLPEQVYWSKARMTVDEYPKASLTLNLFTISLDKKWLDL
ncbi:MAG: type II secretion system protein M [Burkholderiales bacterium]|nr:type II secretion system protein M [Burkholderiales bacterium]